MIMALAVALAMDAMAVSTAQGVSLRRVGVREVVLVALAFGGFQALMPAIGWGVGARFEPAIAEWDHWIAFGLLAVLGGRMVLAAFRPDDDASAPHDLTLRMLMLLAVATSIDALAAGISLPMLEAPPVTTIAAIGLVTAALSAFGILLGRRVGHALDLKLEAVGGLLLVGIGTKILVQHLTA